MSKVVSLTTRNLMPKIVISEWDTGFSDEILLVFVLVFECSPENVVLANDVSTAIALRGIKLLNVQHSMSYIYLNHNTEQTPESRLPICAENSHVTLPYIP